jgi:DNA-directed RNA polymerase I and III subunit RPAC2
MMARNRDVQFVGYSIPHPSEAKLNLRVQTYQKHTHEAVKDGLIDLIDVCEHIKATYKQAVEEASDNMQT